MICLKIRTFVVSATTLNLQRQGNSRCDLLENSYLCGISNNASNAGKISRTVVICLKIRTFVVSATTIAWKWVKQVELWFAWKFVPLWYQQQLPPISHYRYKCCDLLENSYLCGISNNCSKGKLIKALVVICLKIRTFVVSATTISLKLYSVLCCDLLENSYLCGISNNLNTYWRIIFMLWFAWKFVPLWYQQQREERLRLSLSVVICLKIRTFVVSATTTLRQ